MSSSLSFDPALADIPAGHFIGGQLLAGGEQIAVHAPSSGAVVGHIPAGSADIVDQAVRRAAHAQATSGWATCAPRERARVIRQWARLVEENAGRLARLESFCSTRPIAETTAWDVPFTAEGMRFFAEYADKLGGDVAATESNLLGMTIAEPYGVIGAIAPWNFPLVMGSWKVLPALVAGNGVVLKPSEMTPFSAVMLAQLGEQAGLPAGLFNVVQGAGSVVGAALSRHPLVGKLTFTGSTRTGIAVMQAAAESGPKPVTLELGGKSPQVVYQDISCIDTVAARIFRAFTGNAGQVCVTGSRLIVHEKVAAPLIERIATLAGQVRPGPTWDGQAAYAPIISHPQAQRIEDILSRACAAGAQQAVPMRRLLPDSGGVFLSPAVLTNVTMQNVAVREEIFGPVLTVQTFREEEEAMTLAEHPEYGLAAGVHTADLGRAMRAVRRLKAGTVWVNRYGRSADFVIPTGGFGGSGIGKDLGRQAVEANLRHKSVLMSFEG
ncbi:aldehyde dehydrogenase family protein [Komagataeibacter europaeus]|uniref:aldehyde dehydrogenase family protein n=1 Tax=Komagataeibacter europaeus TaxID=33995 RepID=UPI0015FAE9E3|nr:aldehyde dehydrogenase family protein [Komagataeibacter europaeus]